MPEGSEMKGWIAFDFSNNNDKDGKQLQNLRDNKNYQRQKNLRKPKNLRKQTLRSPKNLSQGRRHHLRWIGKLPRKRRKGSLRRRKQRAAESSLTRNGTRSARRRMRTCAKQHCGGHGWIEKLPAELYNKKEVQPEKQF